MIKLTLKDGKILEVESGSKVKDAVLMISQGLARNAVSAKLNDKIVDLRHEIKEDADFTVFTLDDEEGMRTFWHTSSHILAQAVKRLYPEVKLAIGPSTEDGFYYDFDIEKPFTEDELLKIEEECKKIVKESLEIEYFTLPKDEALELMKDEPYKVELINELKDGEVISFYKQGEFTDLCAGPHLNNVKEVKALKILSATGAYWRGSEKNKMLTRLYAVSFPKASILEAHLEMLEEAKRRDHNKLGRELEMFTTSEPIGQGLPLLMPNGARIVQLLQRFVEDEEQKRGYMLTKTPLMAKSDLYKISGHWDHYKDGMFVLGDEEKDEEVFALRPMTCPFQYMIYKEGQKSYKDLPCRYGETSTLFRNEASGEMHGLIRVRQFTISEGHLILTPEQLEEEFKGCLNLAKFMLKTVGLDGDVSYRFSQWDPNNTEKYINKPEVWKDAQDTMAKILDHLEIDYKVGIDEAAFYGPKLDIQIKNVHGKEDTLITIQVDMFLAEQFDMYYIDQNGEKKRPFIIHRTSLGCYERTLALLIEKYAGAFPTWLSPNQVTIIPVSDKFADYANEVYKELFDSNIRVNIDKRAEKVGYKIREAVKSKVPYIIVVGEKDMEAKTVTVRKRRSEDQNTMSIEEFIKDIKEDIETKRISD